MNALITATTVALTIPHDLFEGTNPADFLYPQARFVKEKLHYGTYLTIVTDVNMPEYDTIRLATEINGDEEEFARTVEFFNRDPRKAWLALIDEHVHDVRSHLEDERDAAIEGLKELDKFASAFGL